MPSADVLWHGKESEMENPIIDVIIPVCRPGEKYARLLKMLEKQSVRVRRVYIINTEERFYDKQSYSYKGDINIRHISADEFDHGRTRHEGIMASDADYCLLMTQDAVPADEYLVERLLECFRVSDVAVAYARQLPDEKCRVIERLSRDFNYPAESSIKRKMDIEKLGIKAFFCSDVCAMYDRKKYIEQGGFIKKTIFNEDMIMAYRFLMAGYGIYYKADAMVIHSHNYSNMQQFHRNFDLGVSQADHYEVFGNISSESEGAAYVRRMTRLLIKEHAAYYIPYFYVNSAFRLVGYKLGKAYKKLPHCLVMVCTMNKNYWRQL